MAVIPRKIFHAALGLVMTLVGTAGLFIPLHGELIAVIQLLVYIGAVALAIMFMLMLSPPLYMKSWARNPVKLVVSIVIALALTIPLFVIVLRAGLKPVEATAEISQLREIGRLMLSDFVFPFEIISLVLTIAIIGAIVVARDLSRAEVENRPPEQTGASDTD